MLKLVQAKTKEDIDRIRQLFKAYADALDFDLGFQNFSDEFQNLPGDYAPPKGCLILALDNDEAVGCVALRPLQSTICEMKRLYVKPECRGKKVGRMLAEAIVVEASRRGYDRMRLDTVPAMKTATKLYESIGFAQIPSYRYNPVPGTMYFELEIGIVTEDI